MLNLQLLLLLLLQQYITSRCAWRQHTTTNVRGICGICDRCGCRALRSPCCDCLHEPSPCQLPTLAVAAAAEAAGHEPAEVVREELCQVAQGCVVVCCAAPLQLRLQQPAGDTRATGGDLAGQTRGTGGEENTQQPTMWRRATLSPESHAEVTTFLKTRSAQREAGRVAGTHLQVEHRRVDIGSCCQLSAVDCVNDCACVLQRYALPTAAAGAPSPTCSRRMLDDCAIGRDLGA